MTDFNIPILLLTYNRPELLERVFEQVAKIRPEKIYVVSDGPKNDEDALKIERSREFLSLKSREFTIIQLNRNENLGCRESVSSGISWFFDQEEMGIILEDDCLPSESFFNYFGTIGGVVLFLKAHRLSSHFLGARVCRHNQHTVSETCLSTIVVSQGSMIHHLQ